MASFRGGYNDLNSMPRRKKVSPEHQTETLVSCRRRCCLCFGLRRDVSIKKGQIAHLDSDPSNGALDNLAFLCLDHHDEFDGRTSQSKGIGIHEVKRFRTELYAHFSSWVNFQTSQNLLAFLATTLSYDDLLDGALKVMRYYTINGDDLVLAALEKDEISSSDGDNYGPLSGLLDHLKLWGWLDFKYAEGDVLGTRIVQFNITRRPICNDLARLLRKRMGSG
jgi:hypothetical protein